MARLVALSAALSFAAAAAPVPGFRPPAIPLWSQSPLINVWSNTDQLNQAPPTHWTGASLDFFAGVRVDSAFFLLMGSPSQTWGTLTPAVQTSVVVFATQTVYSFTAGGVAINLTFTSPLITDNWELLSRPAHYATFSIASADGAPHAVKTYFDITGNVRAGPNAWARPVTPGTRTPLSA